MRLLRPLLLVAIAVGGLLATGYQWGAGRERSAHQAEANRAAIAAQKRFDAELLRGETAVAGLLAARAEQAADYDHLEKAFNELLSRPQSLLAGRPKAVRTARPDAGPGHGGAGASGGSDQAVDPESTECATGPAPGADDAGRSPGLSAGAVWMWNSALTGADQPAGACSAADPSEAACAADAGISIEDAWRNHAVNARQCAEDRANHQALIDFITQRNHQEH